MGRVTELWQAYSRGHYDTAAEVLPALAPLPPWYAAHLGGSQASPTVSASWGAPGNGNLVRTPPAGSGTMLPCHVHESPVVDFGFPRVGLCKGRCCGERFQSLHIFLKGCKGWAIMEGKTITAKVTR